jgi:hypothetical protein
VIRLRRQRESQACGGDVVAQLRLGANVYDRAAAVDDAVKVPTTIFWSSVGSASTKRGSSARWPPTISGW